MRFESRRCPKKRKEKKRKETCFVSWKTYLSSCYFFIIHFPLHFKYDILELELTLKYDQYINNW
jgi:hypothetical protein